MTDAIDNLLERLRSHFGERALTLDSSHAEATLELAAADWVGAAKELRDTLGFEIAIDLCGVDYLSFGQDEWETADATSGGFSRGVEGKGPGRFAWGERPSAESVPEPHVNIAGASGSDDGIPTPAMLPVGKPRFAVVLHLLSIQHNVRLRVRCHCDDPLVPVIHSLTSVWPGLNWFERETFDLFGILFDGHPDLRRLLTDYGFVGHPFRKDFPLIGNVEVRYDSEQQRVLYEPVTSVVPRVLVPRVIRDDSRWQQAANEHPIPANPTPPPPMATLTDPSASKGKGA